MKATTMMCWCRLLLLCCLLPCIAVGAAQVELNETKTDVVKRLGRPIGQMDKGNNIEVVFFPGLMVTFSNQLVIKTSGSTTVESKKPEAVVKVANDASWSQLLGTLRKADSNSANVATNTDLAKDATVKIFGTNGSGSGFFISADGYILTSLHVLVPNKDMKVKTRAGKEFTFSSVVTYSVADDLAVIKIDGGPYSFLRPCLNEDYEQGDEILAIGHPYDEEWLISKGYIAGTKEEDGRHDIHCSIDISPGNSGGPMLHEKDGHFCGVTTYLKFHEIAVIDGVSIIDPSSMWKFGRSARDVLTFLERPPSSEALSNLNVKYDKWVGAKTLIYGYKLLDVISREFGKAIGGGRIAMEIKHVKGQSPTGKNIEFYTFAEATLNVDLEKMNVASKRFMAAMEVDNRYDGDGSVARDHLKKAANELAAAANDMRKLDNVLLADAQRCCNDGLTHMKEMRFQLWTGLYKAYAACQRYEGYPDYKPYLKEVARLRSQYEKERNLTIPWVTP